jgi:hypothetical protein
MLTRTTTIIFSAVFLSLTVFAGVIKDGSLRGRSDGANITITWTSEDESGVARFAIERKAGMNGTFMLLGELQPKGNNSSYQFVDDSAFRISESIYQYRVKVTFTSGAAPAYYGPITVSHRTSEVRRTWGSIKAMFR